MKVIELLGGPYDGIYFPLELFARAYGCLNLLGDGKVGIGFPDGWIYSTPFEGNEWVDVIMWDPERFDMEKLRSASNQLADGAAEKWMCIGRDNGDGLKPGYFSSSP